MLKLNKYSKLIISKALILSVFMLFGMLATNQYTLYKRLGFLKSVSDPEGQAARISQVYASNEKLKDQLESETQKRDELRSSQSSSSDLEKLLNSDLNKYQIMSGRTQVEGSGVRIAISHTLVQTQIIDFINALKNIGSEAISINGIRLTSSAPVSQFADQNHFEILVLGNKDTLQDSITRQGGAFDLIVNGVATKMDNLILPAAK